MTKGEGIVIKQFLIQFRPMDLQKDYVQADGSYKNHKDYNISITGSSIEVFLETGGNVLLGEQVKVNLTINGTELACNPVVFVVPASGKIYQTIRVPHNL